MTGLWLASYLVLWGLVVFVCLLLIGTLRQLGLMQRQLESRPSESQKEDSIPDLEHDGPTIGSPLANLEIGTINGYGTIALASLNECGPLLLAFMSPLCETCQHIVEPLNALVADAGRVIRTAVIIRGDEQTSQAFLSLFPLHMPVVCDSERTITMGLDIHRTPFALLYDERRTLIRKGFVAGQDDLLALLGDESAPDNTQLHIFPKVVTSLSANVS